MTTATRARPLLDAAIVRQAIVDSFRKLTPRRQVRNPVMFVVYVGSILTTLLFVHRSKPGARAMLRRGIQVNAGPRPEGGMMMGGSFRF